MSARTPKPRVGLLALTLELYEKLAPDLRRSREQWLADAVIPALGPIADVEFHGAVFRREDVDAAVAELEHSGVDALLVICLSYSPSQIALPALKRTRLPILLWNTQELFAVTEQFTGAEMIANHGVHGTQDLASVLTRTGVRFEYVTSHLQDPAGLEPLEDFFTAAAAVAGLRRLKLGLMGYPFPGMGDFAVDTTELVASLGCQWTALSVEDYIRRAEEAPAEMVAETKRIYREIYDIATDLSDDDLDATARAELSLRSIMAQQHLDAFSYQFLSFGEDERTVTLPFVAAGRLMADGVGFGGEGDLVGAAGTWFLNRLMPPASFTEVFTIDFESGGVFLSHMGEANVAMARSDRKIPLVARPTPIVPTRARQLALVTSFQPGPATLCALVRAPGARWRLIAGRVEIDDYGPLDSMAVPHCRLLCHGDVRQWLTAYAKAGGPHHNALCFGDATPRIRAAAELLDADYCEV